MQTCQFITFGKHLSTSTTSFSDRYRFDTATRPTSMSNRQLREQHLRRLGGGTESGPSTVLCEYQPKVTSSNGTHCKGLCSTNYTLKRIPADPKSSFTERGVENELVKGDEGSDVVGTSYVRSISVPPRLDSRSNVHFSQSSGSAVGDGIQHISPPRMKRRKKKIVATDGTPEPEAVTNGGILNGNTVRPSSSFVRDKARSLLSSKQVPLTPASAIGLCYNTVPDEAPTNGNFSKSSSANGQFTDTSDSGKSSDALTSDSSKYVEWNNETQQSSPDPCSDGDADSKESGYITLEDLQAKFCPSGGRCSWSSEERVVGGCGQATDQDIGGFSSGDERRPVLLSTRRSAAARLPALECFDSVLSSVCSGIGIGSSGAMMPADEFNCCGRQGGIGGENGLTPMTSSSFFECRSAPPTCDSSVLRFTFTVRLDSKMFRRRMMSSATRQRSPIDVVACAIDSGKQSPTLTLVANVGRQSSDQIFSFPICGQAPPILTGRVNVTVENSSANLRRSLPVAPSAELIPNFSTTSCLIGKSETPLPCANGEDFDEGDGHAPPVPKSLVTSTSSVSQPDANKESVKVNPPGSPPKSPFVGEKVVVRAEVHRSADQLDTDQNSTKTDKLHARMSTCGVQTSPANVGFMTANRAMLLSRNGRALSSRPVADDDDEENSLIRCLESTSNYTTTVACTHSQPHTKSTMWNSFHGCLRHVDVDQIGEISDDNGRHRVKKRSEENSIVNKSSVQVAAQTMKKSFRKSEAITRNKEEEVRMKSTCTRLHAAESSHLIQTAGRREVSQGRRKNTSHHQESRVKGRRARRRFGSADSSSMSSDCAAGGESDNELCSPCIHSSSNNAVMSANCCNGHVMQDDRRRIATTANGTSSSSSVIAGTSKGGNSNRKQVRRSIRQFFRVENLFACRLNHGKDHPIAISERRHGDRESDAISGGGTAPTNAFRCRGGSTSNKWFHSDGRCAQRSVSGRSPSTSAVERRGRHRSSRRITATKSSVTVEPSSSSSSTVTKSVPHGSSRSVSPPKSRQNPRSRSRHIENCDDEDDGRMAKRAATMSRQCSTPNCCHGCRPVGDGSTMPAMGHRKANRQHHHCRDTDVVDGAAAMTSVGASGHRQQWVNVAVDSSTVDDGPMTTNQRRKQQTTPAVTPITPSTPGDELVLTPGGDRFVTPSLCSSVSQHGIDFVKSLTLLQHCVWYWGALGFDEAESKLADKPDGTFLVRDSSDDRYILSLSFRSLGATHHTRIEHYKGMFSFYAQPQSHSGATIVEFIDTAVAESRAGHCLYYLRPRAPGRSPAPVRLLYPLSRLRCMHSLRHLCKFIVLRHVRLDMVDRLPVSPRIKEYLKQSGCGSGSGHHQQGTIVAAGGTSRTGGTVKTSTSIGSSRAASTVDSCGKQHHTEGFNS